MKADIPKNIQRYENKFFLCFTKRQTVFVTLAVCIFLFAYKYLAKTSISNDNKALISFALAMPVAFMGYAKITGLYMEKIIAKIFKEQFFKADYRPFKMEGFKNEKK